MSGQAIGRYESWERGAMDSVWSLGYPSSASGLHLPPLDHTHGCDGKNVRSGERMGLELGEEEWQLLCEVGKPNSAPELQSHLLMTHLEEEADGHQYGIPAWPRVWGMVEGR